ncbi:NAD(P)-binding protein [Dentipellis sp. KUC8613]|nr:NAD(P)-binding protein [Dentipellis sp. KUC8613]
MSFASDLFSAAGRTALITGGGTGLGYWMAEAWVKNGGKVYITGRREEVLKQAAAKLNIVSKGSASFFPADVATQEGIDNITKEISARATSLDVLVCNAGVGIFDLPEPGAILARYDHASWMRQYTLNAWSPAALTSALAPLLVKAAKKGEGRGSVIFISSISDSVWFAASPIPGYTSSKVAQGALNKVLANKLATHGVRVNTIAPGTFPTPANDPSNPVMPSAKADEFVPMKRNGGADDIAGAFMFLATKASAYVTGQRFAVDGGWLLVVNGRDNGWSSEYEGEAVATA